MQHLLIPFLILGIISCNETTSGIKGLTDSEIEYLRQRAALKCNSDNEPNYVNFKKISDDVFLSTSWNRGYGQQYEFKQESATTTGFRRHIRVWKRDQNSRVMYFYVTETTAENAATSYFLRVDEVKNDALIDKLLADHCGYAKYTASTGKSGPLTVKHEYYLNIEDSKTRHFTDTYTFNFSDLAFFGGTRLQRSLVEKDSTGKEISGTSQKYATTVTSKNETFDATYQYNGLDANGQFKYTQTFCELTSSNFRLMESSTSYPRGGFSMPTCEGSLPAGWNLAF